MTSAELERVRKDLEVMDQAVAAGLPFDRSDLKWGWIDGLVFVPLAIWAWLGPGTYMSLAIILSLLATLPGAWAIRRKHRQQRDRRPSPWREERLKTMILVCAVPMAYLLAVWAIANGTPPNTMVGLCLAVGGGVATIMGIVSDRRRYFLGIGIPIIVGGLVMPGATDQQVGLAMALMFIIGAPVSTAIAAWQLRAEEKSSDTY